MSCFRCPGCPCCTTQQLQMKKTAKLNARTKKSCRRTGFVAVVDDVKDQAWEEYKREGQFEINDPVVLQGPDRVDYGVVTGKLNFPRKLFVTNCATTTDIVDGHVVVRPDFDQLTGKEFHVNWYRFKGGFFTVNAAARLCRHIPGATFGGYSVEN